MRSRAGPPRPLELGALAAAGALAAHGLAYLLIAPSQAQRVHVLRATGHGDWSLVGALGLGLAVAGLAQVGWPRLRGARRAPPDWRRLALALALLQTGGFVALELWERGAMGRAPASALAEPVVLLGIVLQIVVATAAALLARGVVAAVDAVAARRKRPRRARCLTPAPAASEPAPCARPATGGATLRAPPRAIAAR